MSDEFAVSFITEIIEEAEIANNQVRRRTTQRTNPLDIRDVEFIKKFRLTKRLFDELVHLLEPLIPRSNININTKILSALIFFATGSYQTPIGNSIYLDMSQATVSRCINEVVEALTHETIFTKYVYFPRTFQDMNTIVRDFYTMYDFPGIIGCIDCTHVAIVPPPSTIYDERSYVNRKNYHSINTQLICDANLKILNVNALFPGSTHDCHIWNSSNVLSQMERFYTNGQTNYHLLGDSGYALRPWCLTPLSDPEEGTACFRYNEALVKARSTIERCNGVLKARFRCLLKDRVLHYRPEKATKIINACTVLHNMCILNNVPSPNMDLNINELGMIDPLRMEPDTTNQNRFLIAGRNKQNYIIDNYF